MSSSGSAPRDDNTPRPRRRRRRPPPPGGHRAPDTDTSQTYQNQQSTNTRPPRRAHPSASGPRHGRSQSPLTPTTPPGSRPRISGSRSADRRRDTRNNPNAPTIPPNNPSKSSPSTPKRAPSRVVDAAATAAALAAAEATRAAEEARLEAEAREREAREKEAQEEAQRAAIAAQLLAKRGDERQKNLPFLPSPLGEEPTNQRPSDAELRQFDSSLKKCTGFIRKIRFSGVNEESVQSLCTEAQTLNLSRYISEIVSAMTEGKLRSADVEHFVTLAGELHRRYEEFTPQLSDALIHIVNTSSATAKELTTRKAAMRLLVEIYVLAMLADIHVVIDSLRQLVRPMRESKDELLNNLSIIASFVRAGSRPLIGAGAAIETGRASNSSTVWSCGAITSTSMSTSWEDDVSPQSTKQSILAILETFFNSDVDRLVKESVDDLRKARDALTRSKQVRDLPDDATQTAFEASKQFCERAVTGGNVLAEVLSRPTFSTPVEALQISASGEGSGGSEVAQVSVVNLFSYVSKNRQALGDMDVVLNADHPFESDEQRMFYTELVAVESMAGAKGSVSADKGVRSSEDGDKQSEDAPANQNGKGVHSQSVEVKKKGVEKPVSLERLLSKLSSIETKEAADTFVQQFVVSREGSRNGTKRLGKALFSVSAQKLNVLPAYARIAATIQPLYSDVATFVATSLEQEFRYFVGKADVDEKILASCIKSAQYVGEYVKFGLIPISLMFDMLTLCTKDLTAHRVDAACHLLETCGRYVYRTSSSHIRMSSILDTLWRVKSVKNLEAKHNTLIENAFFAVKLSPGSKAQKIKTRPPLHEYIRHLIYHRLDGTNITWVRNQLLKLPWDDELEQYVVNKFVKISRARFSTITHIAALIAALQKHKPTVIVGIVDALIECIRSGMEKNDGRESQRRVAEVFLLGEMHNCGVVDDRLIYNILYLIISLGHDSSENGSTTLRRNSGLSMDVDNLTADMQNPRLASVGQAGAPDPAGDYFRIRLACVLVDACGRTLLLSNRRKLEVFWVFLERYLFCKTYQSGLGDRVPLHIDHILQDALDGVLHGHRRVGKEMRGPSRGDYGHSFHSQESGSWPSTLRRPFKRSRTLEEALQAVVQVERSPSDVALILVPKRQVILASPRVRGDVEENGNGSVESLKSRSGTSTITGNMRDGFQTTNVAEVRLNHARSSEEEDDGGDDVDSTCEGGLSQEDEDGVIVDGEDDMSGDDLDSDDGTDDFMDEEGDADDDDNDEDDDDEDDDDDVLLDTKSDRPKTEEEDAFAKELAAFTAEAVQDARSSLSRVTKLDRMAIPMSLMTKRLEEERAAAAAQAMNGMEESESSDDEDEDDDRHIAKSRSTRQKNVEFKVLMRKGGKSQLQGLQVPASSSLAVAAKESESADARRHEETKRLVLESSIVQNEDTYDFEEDVPMRVEQNVRTREENIRQQRSNDEMELLATLYRSKPRR